MMPPFPWDLRSLEPADDDTDPAADTQPLWTPGTPFADEHLRTLTEIGLVTPDVDTENDDD